MSTSDRILQVRESGRRTVVAFDGQPILDHVNVADCRDEIIDLLREHQCDVFGFDLAGVRLIPSGLLGLLASLPKLGVEVELLNPSDDVREVLEIAHFEQVMTVRCDESDATAG